MRSTNKLTPPQIGYGFDSVCSEVKSKAVASLGDFFEIPGQKSVVQVQADIKWLLEKSQFLYRGLDLKVLLQHYGVMSLIDMFIEM